MTKTIALFGGSFNPPGLHHWWLAKELCSSFDEVLVVPCGPRPDKRTVNDIDPVHRAAMVDMAFRRLSKVRVELFDLENASFTRTYQLAEMFEEEGEVWIVVGADLLEGGGQDRSFIHREWSMGPQLWNESRFAVFTRPGCTVDRGDLPPRCRLFETAIEGSSSDIRERVFKGGDVSGLVAPEVADYIERYGLYRGGVPRKTTGLALESPRPLVVADSRNPVARELAATFSPLAAHGEPNCILVIGGDGTMLHAIRNHWRVRLPFLGINAGHRGFLLNDVGKEIELGNLAQDLILRQLQLLYVETRDADGECISSLAFNDAWMERATGQAAWLEVAINGQVRFGKLVADGVLVSTAAGSTAYARAMGATPLLVDSQALLLVGSNVMEPPGWVSAHVSIESTIAIRALSTEKRPVAAFVDGISQGHADSMLVRASRIAAVELAFSPHHDMAEKLAQIQFPRR